MDWMPIVSLVLNLIFGGGLVTALTLHRKSKAELMAAEAAQASTSTDGWDKLMSYWQGEITALRDGHTASAARITVLEALREDDMAHIGTLEQWIWEQKPPPPPPRGHTTVRPSVPPSII